MDDTIGAGVFHPEVHAAGPVDPGGEPSLIFSAVKHFKISNKY